MLASNLPAISVTAVLLADDDDNTDGNDAHIPTIELSSRAEVHAVEIGLATGNGDEDDSSSFRQEFPSLAVAEQVPTSVRDICYEDVEGIGGATSTRLGRYYNSHNDASSSVRAAFVSASFVKESPFVFLGIKLARDSSHDNGVASGIIEKIADKSPVKHSPLRVGNKLISINHHQCCKMSNNVQIVETLKNLEGRITVVAQNTSSDENAVASDVVESMMTKTNPNDVLGIALSLVTVNQRRRMRISYIDGDSNENAGIADSLLNVGDEVLTINGLSVRHLTCEEAKAIIANAPKTVTIKAITEQETGVVLAELSTRFIPTTTTTTTPVATAFSGTATTTTNNNTHETEQAQQQCARNIAIICGALTIFVLVFVLGGDTF